MRAGQTIPKSVHVSNIFNLRNSVCACAHSHEANMPLWRVFAPVDAPLCRRSSSAHSHGDDGNERQLPNQFVAPPQQFICTFLLIIARLSSRDINITNCLFFCTTNIARKKAQTSSLSNGGGGAQSQRVTTSRVRLSDIKRSMNGKNLTCVGVHPTINQSTSVELDVQCKCTAFSCRRLDPHANTCACVCAMRLRDKSTQ